MYRSSGRLRLIGIGVCTVLALGLLLPARADDKVLPGSCKTHHNHVLNPGCVPALENVLLGDSFVAYPNLVPEVADVNILEIFNDDETTSPWIFFDTHSENRGTVAMDLLLQTEDLPDTTVAQCVAWSTEHKYVCRDRVEVGGFTFHTEHAHFHFEEFATYEFRRLGPDGRPDYSEAAVIGSSPKVSFCLVDTEPAPGYENPEPTATYSQCLPTRQGISPGWTDIYTSGVPGQGFSIAGVEDGRYALVITLDPNNRLYESDDTDNRVAVIVEVSDNLQTVEIVEKQR